MKTNPALPLIFYSWRRHTSDEKLKELWLGIREGRIFCDRNVRPGDFDITASIFMPIALGGPQIIRQLKLAQIDLIYEYMSNAGPRSINGYPIFWSMRMLNRADTARLWEIKDKVEAALSQV